MSAERSHRAAVVTVSDGVVQGTRTDESGPALREILHEAGFQIAHHEAVMDDQRSIEELLSALSNEVSLIVTTGGTGLGPRDVTPEATRSVIDREVPGLGEEMRAAGRSSTPMAALSRGIAGSRGACLILNVPGSKSGATESLKAILRAIPHALDLLGGQTAHASTPPRSQTRSAGPNPSDGDVVIATAVKLHGDPPCHVGQKIVIGRNGPLSGTLGCAEFDDAAIADTPAVLDARSPLVRTYTHELGSIEVFLEPSVRSPKLVVVSATPVALDLLRWGRDLGFEPVLVESRSARVTSEFRALSKVVKSIAEVALDSDTAAIHTDHDAPDVVESVAALLRSPARFIGVMGSTRHVSPHVERLSQMGFDEREIERIRTPVGLDIGARTPEEIALSILAGVVAERRGGHAGWLDHRVSNPGVSGEAGEG
ncbi:MAG TPA: molybdenum cofactor synthesis domain-containing protein [Actinomycetota bacterium]|nr:molybdenum cofactor synthesis domain-containing protein [Actinomycetota bacterium]